VAQLDRLERFVGVRHIKLGVIPLTSSLPALEVSSFTLYDAQELSVNIANTDLIYRSGEIIADHLKVFSELEKRAEYGSESVALLRKAVTYFT
jgi:Domain of unknown function (DUF5753)